MKFVFIRCFLAFILMASACLAEDITGTFKCNVIDVSLTTIEGGKYQSIPDIEMGCRRAIRFISTTNIIQLLTVFHLKEEVTNFELGQVHMTYLLKGVML